MARMDRGRELIGDVAVQAILIGDQIAYKRRPRSLDCIGSSYAPSILMTWLHALHSNVCRSVPRNAGMIWASIIWAWHFGQAGRLMGASGTMDDRG
jgi:hypothetical protein